MCQAATFAASIDQSSRLGWGYTRLPPHSTARSLYSLYHVSYHSQLLAVSDGTIGFIPSRAAESRSPTAPSPRPRSESCARGAGGQTARGPRVRETPSWPRSWANLSLLSLCSHRNARASVHLLGQPDTLLAPACRRRGAKTKGRAAPRAGVARVRGQPEQPGDVFHRLVQRRNPNRRA